VDGSHLHRYFLKHYAATPGRYREESRQRPPATHLPIKYGYGQPDAT
jgi:AraC-like DNA-binding protein